MGYASRPTLRKGFLSEKDTKRGLQWAKEVHQWFNPESRWTDEIKFYFNGKTFVHKTSPLDHARAPGARIWRRANVGLHEHCTSKGSKRNSGKRVHFFVAMLHKNGVVLCEKYNKLTGQMFADFVREHFLETFRRYLKVY